MAYDKETWRKSVSNGKIPPTQLANIWPTQYDYDLGGPAKMHPDAALAMGILLRQAWEDGSTGLRVKYSYRTYAKQKEKWDAYQNGTGNLAAYPGTSNHGWAVAVDFTGLGEDEIVWLRRNAHTYGFKADVPSENWHYTFQDQVGAVDRYYKWDGSEMTEDEKKLLTWLDAFKRGTTQNLPGEDSGSSIGRRTADAIKHSQGVHVTKKHTHGEGKTGLPIEGTDGHTHSEGKTGPAVEP